MAKKKSKRNKIILFYAILFGLLHHAIYGFVKPLLNRIIFLRTLPSFFLGTTFVVTLLIIAITYYGTKIILKILKNK